MKLFSTSCDTLFLGWDSPLLPAAVAKLRERFSNRHRLDLSNLICVLPSAHSVRRLDWLLHRESQTEDLQYDPPEIITVGQLAERLYQPPRRAALEFEQTLAWTRVLRAKHPEDLEPLLSSVPAAEPLGPWLELAGTLRRLHEELSANRLTFEDVVEAAETDAEKRRWKLLTKLFATYLGALQEAGLCDPHWARRHAVLQERCDCDRTIVLIGTSDLSQSLVDMLRSLDTELISMVGAPASDAFRFDEIGCVDTDGWIDHHLPITDDQLISAGDMEDQATAVTECLAEFANEYSPDQVTVGVTDESHVGPIEVQLRGCGVSTYRHLGWTIGQTAVGRLLDLAAAYLNRRTWQALAALVRHADVCDYVTRSIGTTDSSEWLIQLDQLLSDHYPVRTSDPLAAEAVEKFPLAQKVGQCIDKWLAVFADRDRSVAQWSHVMDDWLQELFGTATTDPASTPTPAQPSRGRTEMALEAARRVIGRFAELNDQLDLTVGGAAAIEMLAGRLAEVRVIDTAKPEDVEILGWLDLALDDAPALVVIGLNHPFVPGAVTNDPFLPGSLRTRLRMADNDRRYARDVYAMHLMLSTRSIARFIVGRTAADQSPTPPSRLLAATPSNDAARRVRGLLGSKRKSTPVHHRWDEGPERGLLPIPELSSAVGGDTVQTLSVTAFRDYLTCPYRFYLRHVLKLRPLDDAGGELAANQFGDLVHGSLERFGESAERDEGNRSKIEAMLIQHLHDYAAERYGDSVSTAVTLQIAQAERRLKAVAAAQADRVAAGWTIHASEASVDERDGAGIDVDGQPMGLRGRFDRIDYHAASDRWAILDYKTHGHRPEKKHLRRSEEGYEWIDLQLPLYRRMIPFLGIDANPDEVELGYFNVSEKDEETRINIADFSTQLLDQADELIVDSIRRIRAGEFQPTNDRVQFDDYGMILQTGVASRLLDQADLFLGEEAEA